MNLHSNADFKGAGGNVDTTAQGLGVSGNGIRRARSSEHFVAIAGVVTREDTDAAPTRAEVLP
jgi:hypothetical protein